MIDHDIAIIGAGFSGIGAAVSLTRAGLTDHVLLEQGDDFGGTWYWNRYPGIAVDIPSFSYQFSFAQRADWSRSYAPGSELLAYAQSVADEHGLRARTRFGVTVTGATFDEDEHVWRLTTSDGELTVRHVIDGSGVLTVPKKPDIAGVDDFAGTTVHTARWDESLDLTGKRVAVIGTGASAVQLIPTIAGVAEHLTVFQRTPIWCLPKFDFPLPGALSTALRRVPGVQRAVRLASQAYVESTFVLPAQYHRPLSVTPIFEKAARRYIAQQVHDPETAAKLTPQYAIGCKRPSFHNTYLSTFNRPDVSLETTPIAEITAGGVRCEDGTVHEVDVLVLATGFAVFDRGNLPKFPVIGRDGADLGEYWETHRYRSYEGVAVPGFPNWFTVFGPYGYNGSSYFALVEAQTGHITRALVTARDRGATAVEPTAEATERYFAEMMRRRHRQVFWQSSCSLANSYYFNADGDVPLRPTTTIESIRRAKSYPLADYTFTRAEVPVTA